MSDANPRTEGARVFISYSRSDLVIAEPLRDTLRQAGFDAYLDMHDIAPGEDWKARLGALIASAEKVVFLISPGSVASDVCAWEVDEAERQGKSILPVVVRETDVQTVPGRLARLNFIFYRDAAERGAGLAALTAALDTDLAWEREKTRVNDLAQTWERAGRPLRLLTWREDAIRALEKWRDGHPATSSAPTAAQLAYISESRLRFSRRQRWIRGGLGFIAIASTALASFAGYQYLIAKEETRRAENNLQTAYRAADSVIFILSQEIRRIDGVPTQTKMEILKQAAVAIAVIEPQKDGSTQLDYTKAILFRETSLLLQSESRLIEAERFANESLDTIKKYPKQDFERDTGVDYDRALAHAHNNLAMIKYARGEYGESQRLLNLAAGPSGAGTAENPETCDLDRERLHLQGLVYHANSQFSLALAAYEKAKKAATCAASRFQGGDGKKKPKSRELWIAYFGSVATDIRMAEVLFAQGHVALARSRLEEALASIGRVASASDAIESIKPLSQVFAALATVSAVSGSIDETIAFNQRAINQLEKLLQLAPDEVLLAITLVEYQVSQLALLLRSGSLNEFSNLAPKVDGLIRAHYGKALSNPRMFGVAAHYKYTAGDFLVSQSDLPAAERAYREAISLLANGKTSGTQYFQNDALEFLARWKLSFLLKEDEARQLQLYTIQLLQQFRFKRGYEEFSPEWSRLFRQSLGAIGASDAPLIQASELKFREIHNDPKVSEAVRVEALHLAEFTATLAAAKER